MKFNLLVGAQLFEVFEGLNAERIDCGAMGWRDSCPRLVFDKGTLNIENPLTLKGVSQRISVIHS